MATDQMATDQRISLNPTHPVQGGTVTICYDFTDLTLTKNTLEVSFFPYGSAEDHEVTREQPCVTLPVPNTALALLIKDLDGSSPDQATAIVPAV